MIFRILFYCLIALPVHASEWGRLFYSEQERQEGVVKPITTSETSKQTSKNLRFDGELQTPRGKVRWVNGQRAVPPAGIKPGESWQETH